jgi:4-amino-4-deoxy-L-arabinose transferase-like glycosyltransferase
VSQKVLFADDAPAVPAREPEPASRALPPRGALLLLLLVGALALLRLGAVPLLGPDEPRYARVAVEMQRAGAWVTPTLQGEPWLEKPPLYYWLAGAAFRVLGETETAARLPAVLALLLLTGATALVAARLYGAAAGLHAGFAAGTCLLTFAYGRAASMDMLLAACVTAATGLVALRLLGVAGRAALPAAGVFVGLALLAKGPLGLLLPALACAAFLLVTRDRAAWNRLVRPAWMLVLAAALCALVALPWYLAAWRAHGREFVDVFLLNHNLQRFTSTIHRHPGPVVYYLPVLLIGLFPWAGLVPAALGSVRPRGSRADLFVLCWLLLPLAFFSLAGSKLPGYILPCLPPLAILLGRLADRWTRGTAGAGGRVAALLGLVLAALVFAAAFVLRAQGEPRWQLLVPLGAWSLVVAFLFSRTIGRDPVRALTLLRVGAAGTLLLVVQAAPPLLAARESGRALFLPANGQDVIAWGAWRTAWMAGYFYNDGRVRQVEDFASVNRALEAGPTLVLAGPAERKRLEGIPSLRVTALAQGPRQNALLHVVRR